ncbi:hypothetical protein ACA910_018962 [Epithemia clementina (nom. ined.)]
MVTTAQAGLVHVLTHCWAQRFEEVEWPVLILLHYIKELVETIHSSSLATPSLPTWPSAALGCFNAKQAPASNEEDPTKNQTTSQDDLDDKTTHLPLFCPKFDAALMVWLGWDTDQTDVDLHVNEPSGKQVYFGRKRGTASLLSRDFTQGYVPEVYLVKANGAIAGEYQVHAKYYASHQDSALTGTTSAVVWTIEKEETPTSTGGSSGLAKRIKFDFVRLDTHKQMTHVTTAKVPPK